MTGQRGEPQNLSGARFWGFGLHNWGSLTASAFPQAGGPRPGGAAVSAVYALPPPGPARPVYAPLCTAEGPLARSWCSGAGGPRGSTPALSPRSRGDRRRPRPGWKPSGKQAAEGPAALEAPKPALRAPPHRHSRPFRPQPGTQNYPQSHQTPPTPTTAGLEALGGSCRHHSAQRAPQRASAGFAGVRFYRQRTGSSSPTFLFPASLACIPTWYQPAFGMSNVVEVPAAAFWNPRWP